MDRVALYESELTSEGPLYEARHDYPAAEIAFRNAIFSPNLGYTRANMELAHVLLAAGRPREAVPVLRAGLRGGLEGSCYYVTRNELQEMLARAFDAAGQRDSAVVYRSRVDAAFSRRTRADHGL